MLVLRKILLTSVQGAQTEVTTVDRAGELEMQELKGAVTPTLIIIDKKAPLDIAGRPIMLAMFNPSEWLVQGNYDQDTPE